MSKVKVVKEVKVELEKHEKECLVDAWKIVKDVYNEMYKNNAEDTREARKTEELADVLGMYLWEQLGVHPTKELEEREALKG